MWSNIIREKYLQQYPIPVSIDCTTKILEQMKKCICKIKINQTIGTGFFCNILSKNKKVMITNNHIINEEVLKENKNLIVTLNDDTKIEIDLNNKKMYTNIEYDTTILEIKKEEENKLVDLIDYLIFEESKLDTKQINKSLYILQYPNILYKGNGNSSKQIASVSYGIIQDIKYYTIYHSCNTESASSGSPILDLSNNKVIGIHNGTSKDNKSNLGIDLQYPINDYLNEEKLLIKDNCVSMELKIEKKDINKQIYFLNNIDKQYSKYMYNNIKELNESNTQIFINDNEKKFAKYFEPKEIGIYKIKIKFRDNIKDCRFMFCNCRNIISLDLSSFDTKNSTNMANMFFNCVNITNIDLHNFNTNNVTNMEFMFSSCKNIKILDLTSFNTKNVTNMEQMFFDCQNLTNINLSSFNTENVTNMNYMFYGCSNLVNLNLSSFDTHNVNGMKYMFSNCTKLSVLDLRYNFNTTNVTNMSYMFYNCENITNLNLYSFITNNVTNMKFMFNLCKNLIDLDLSSFNTENVKDMTYMFAGCESIQELDLSSFNTKNVTTMQKIFFDCEQLKNVKIKKNINENLVRELQIHNKEVNINE